MAEKANLILVAVGPDTVGLVEKISEFIAGRGCNIEDGKMAVFLGEFAFILLISGGPNDLARVRNEIADLGAKTDLKIWLKEPAPRKPSEPSLPYRLIASCMDHPGVVYRLSAMLSRLGINIESMETETHEAPVTGAPVFRMEAVVSVPARQNINQLREDLSQIEKEENIDIELTLIRAS